MQRKRRFDAGEMPLRCGRNAASMREKRRFDAGETSLRCERNGTSKEICDTVAHLFACPTAERDLCNMENENEVRSRAVNLLLERGARFVVPLPRPYARLIPKRWRTMTIRHHIGDRAVSGATQPEQ